MTVELRSLRVVPELDASKYTAGAQQKVAADKAMTASSQAVGAAAVQTDTKISQAGDVLARLSRQYVDGYANAQKMQSAVNALSRGVETGKITMAQAQPILDGIFRKYGQLGDGAQFAAKGQHEFAAAISNTTARLAAQVTAANAAAQSTGRVNVAANQNGFRGAQNFSAANVAAQFQDIGVTAAMGMSPLQIALQQGTQLSAVLGTQGAAGAARTLGAALMSVVSPVSLITIGIVGLSAAAIQYFGRLMTDSDNSAEALKEQAELISGVARRWGEALPAIKAYNEELVRTKEVEDALAAAKALANKQYADTRAEVAELTVGIVDLISQLQHAGADPDMIIALQRAFSDLQSKVKDGSATVDDARRVLDALGVLLTETGIPAIADYAGQVETLGTNLGVASEKARKFREEAAMLQFKGSLGPLNGLNVFQSTPFQTEEDIMFERSRRAREAEEARIGGLEIGGFVPTPRPNDIERLGEGPSGADYIRSQQERIELLKEEMGLVGQSAEVRQRAIAVLQVEQEIRRRGLDLHGEEAEAMRANALLELDLIQQVAERRKKDAEDRRREIEELDEIRSTFRGFLSDLKNGLKNGESFWEAFGNAALRVLDRIMDKWLDLLTEILFGKQGTNQSGMLGNLLGSLMGSNGGGFSPTMTASQFFGAGAPVAANNNVNPSLGNVGSTIDFMKAAGGVTGDMSRYREAIASIESMGSGGYSAIGPTHPKYGRALGRYQVMEANVGPWSEAALGRRIGADEFMANPGMQDKIFDHRFGGYVDKYGESGAASMWFTGRPNAPNAKDVLGTSGSVYVDKFNAQLKSMGDTAQNSVKGLTSFNGGLTEMAGKLTSPSGPLGGLFGTGLNNTTNFTNGAGGGLGALLGYGGSGAPQSGGGGFGGLFGMLLGFLPKLFGFAEGTENAPPGYAWVGERGPEIVKFRGGEQVVPNHRLGAANQNAQPGKVDLHVHVSGASGDDHVRKLAKQGAYEAIGAYHEAQAQGGFGALQARYSNQKG